MMKIFKSLVVTVIVLTFSINSSGQDAVRIKRLSEPVVFDGHPDESVWKTLVKFPLVMHRPNFMAVPSEDSEVWIGYDNEFLWVGARLYMKDASKIFAVTKKRDEMLFGYDAFGVILDTYNDNENGLAFFTAPTGLRTDYTISNDASGNHETATNTSWNTFWDVKTTRDDKGWYVEMRIPFSSLKFKPVGDLATMGIIITRNISANNETDTYPAIDPKYGFMATNKVSQAQTIEIEGAKPLKPVYISPYVIGGLSWDWEKNEPETEYVKSSPFPDRSYNAGLDVKYNINSNLTLDLTANTDFAQVEADDQQVNLTRYSLYFPEKRMFFQERSSLFDFSLGGRSDNLFYSRRIGISEGEPIRIYGGARITGRLGRWDMGFLDMQTEEHENTPGENFGVLRMRRQVINQNSYVGGIVTSRLGMNGAQNLAYGLDGIFRIFGDDYINLKWAQAYDSESGERLNSLDPSFILASWERRSEEGFAYNINYTYSGKQFNPGIGFIQRGGVQGVNGQLLYGWIPGDKSRLHDFNINVRAERYNRIEDGNLEAFSVSPGFEVNTKKNLHTEISLEYQKEGVLFDFPLSEDVWIKAGEYSFLGFEGRIGTSESRVVSAMVEFNGGRFYDGNRLGIQMMPNFNLSSSLKISGGYEYNRIWFPDREINTRLNIHSLNMRAIYMLNTKLSATILVQYVNTEDELIGNFRLRYNPREGNDFYLVYNDFRGLNRFDSYPKLPVFFNRTVMVKYTHTFIL